MSDPKRIWVSAFGFVFLVLLVIPAVVQADAPAVCLIDDHPGILESDAQTAALLVCDELRKQGISVSDPVYEAPQQMLIASFCVAWVRRLLCD